MKNNNVALTVIAIVAANLLLSNCHRMDYKETVGNERIMPGSYPADPYGARASIQKKWIKVGDLAINRVDNEGFQLANHGQ